MKNHVRLVLGLVLCVLGIGILGCPTDGGDSGGIPDLSGPNNPNNPGDPNNPDNPNNTDNPDDTNTPVDVQTALTSGHGSLTAKDYDKALEHYRAAYNAGKTNPDAITYSVLAELAAISIDPKVRNLLKDRLGVEGYPGTMGALFTTDWMAEYQDQKFMGEYYEDGKNIWWIPTGGPNGPGYYYYDGGSPVFVSGTKKYETYSGKYPGLTLPGWFESTSVYRDSLTDIAGVGAVQSTATLPLLLAANLLDKNTDGLNDLFAGVLDSVFGSTFEAVAARVSAMDPNAEVTLNTDVIAALGLDELLEGAELTIGKYELDVLIAGLRIVKATFEWLASYDWNADFSFAKFDWADHSTFEAAIRDVPAANLPFRNGFLNTQDPVMLNTAKGDYLAALSAISSVYDAIGDRSYIPQGVKDELDNYRWIQDGVNQLHNLIRDGGTFWIPEDLPSGQTWTGTQANAMFGIDMGKLFQPDYLKLNETVELEGTNPVFYGFTGDSDSGTKITASGQIDAPYEAIGFKIKLGKIQGLAPKAFTDNEVTVPMFPLVIAEELYKKYYQP
ncbi:MAG: hypothetical protein LBP74_06450 [Treponema sp.]|jgi:hypothetical protein|nr:hypothetical protein [Treponema sp.]